MIIGNINLNVLNMVKDNPTILNQGINFDNILNELLKILFEEKSLNLDIVNSMILPAGALPFTPYMGNEQNLSQFTEFFNNENNLKASILNFAQFGGTIKEIYNLWHNVKANDEEFCMPNHKTYDEILNMLKSSVQDSKIMEIQKIFQQSKTEHMDANISVDTLTQSKTLDINTNNNKVDKISMLSSFIKDSDFQNTDIKEIAEGRNIKVEISSPQINMSSDFTTRSGVEQKIQLPFTRLQEISDIIFKAFSTSQKTLTVQLEPPELGKILIKLSLDSLGVRADMKVEYPYVKEILTGLIPEIKNNLQSSGVKVSDFLLELTRDYRGYSDSYSEQRHRKYKGNQKFFEYFV